MNKVSVVIPSFNGQELLAKNLPYLLKAIDLNSEQEIIIVDDGSTDNTVTFLKAAYPQIKVMASPINQGFAKSCNWGVKAVSNEIVVLLNNDVRVSEDFLAPLVKHFQKEDVFAVGAKVFFEDGKRLYQGKTEFFTRYGLLGIKAPAEVEQAKLSYTAYVGGGMAAFSREKFLKLGGFSEIYAPFYWEDVDLCYRAWRRGWKVLYEPESIMYHAHQGTIGKHFSQEYIEAYRHRNSILFIWRNISDKKMLWKHFFWLLLIIINNILHRRFLASKVIFLSLSSFLSIRKMLLADKQFLVNNDREIFEQLRRNF